MKTILSLKLFCAIWFLSTLASSAADPLDQWRQIDDTGNSPGLAMRYGQGKWVGFRGSSIVTSTNRTDWRTTMFFGSDDYASDLEFASGLWVIAGTRQSTNIFILTSLDGETWTAATNLTAITVGGRAPQIRRGPEEWVVVLQGMLLRSPDARNWTQSPIGNAPAGANQGWIYDIAYGGGFWLGIVYESGPAEVIVGSLAVSTNLTDWHWWQRPGPAFNTLKYAHGLWFGTTFTPGWYSCGAVQTPIVTSVDGTNWTTHFVGNGLGQIALVDNRIVATATIHLCVVISTNAPILPMFESDPLISLQQSTQGEITVTRAAGIPVIVESSDDLRGWNALTNLPAGDPVQSLTDSAGSSTSARFYRARTP
jgi:hypothetical protein